MATSVAAQQLQSRLTRLPTCSPLGAARSWPRSFRQEHQIDDLDSPDLSHMNYRKNGAGQLGFAPPLLVVTVDSFGLRGWQGRQESNPQPAVLETAALPIELRP